VNPCGQLGDYLERVTLESWVNQTGVLDLGILRDWLAESYEGATAEYRGALAVHDWRAAESHLADRIQLGRLVGIVDDELRYRRLLVYAYRPWPLVPLF
jgi:hypothetical protein